MNKIKEYIKSGILELYVTGNTTDQEKLEVEQMAEIYPEIAAEIKMITLALEEYVKLNDVTPNPTIKPFLMAVIDYNERLKKGESPTYPPVISENSSIADYFQWLNRPDMAAPEKLEDVYAKIIGTTNQVLTAIVWIKEMAPQEVHDNEIEKFLIVEGSCDITIGEKIHQLFAGDILSIPLHKNHFVKVTSASLCKVILQRIAA